MFVCAPRRTLILVSQFGFLHPTYSAKADADSSNYKLMRVAYVFSIKLLTHLYLSA